MKVKVKLLSRVRLLATPWTAAYQAPPPVGFSRQEYWSGMPLPLPIFGCMQLQIMDLSRYMPKNGIDGSHGSLFLAFLRNLHTAVHSGCNNLHSHQQCGRVLFSYLQDLLFVNILIMTILTGVQCYLLFLHFSISDVEHIFTCLLAICIPFLEKYLLVHHTILLIGCFVFFVLFFFFFFILSGMSCLCILKINILSVSSLTNIFSHSEGCIFIWFMVSFAMQKLSSLIRSYLYILILHPSTAFQDSFVDHDGYSISSKGFLPAVVDIMAI